MRAGVVRKAERADDELTRPHGAYRTAYLDDHAAVFMAHMGGPLVWLQSAIGPEVGATDAGRRKLYDRVGRLHNFGIFDLFKPDVAWPVHYCREHDPPPSDDTNVRCKFSAPVVSSLQLLPIVVLPNKI